MTSIGLRDNARPGKGTRLMARFPLETLGVGKRWVRSALRFRRSSTDVKAWHTHRLLKVILSSPCAADRSSTQHAATTIGGRTDVSFFEALTVFVTNRWIGWRDLHRAAIAKKPIFLLYAQNTPLNPGRVQHPTSEEPDVGNGRTSLTGELLT